MLLPNALRKKLKRYVTVRRLQGGPVFVTRSGRPLSRTNIWREMEDFLSQLSMKVYNGKKLIYEASPDELDGLKNNVLLGKFYEGRGTTLTVELKVPETLGSEYAGRIGEVDWVFIAEEVPMPNPPTGDNSDLLLWGGAFLAAAAAVTVVIVTGRKKKAQ